jgi:UDP-N-acetylglucosamine 2-epimerase (non-hydrolysing)
MIIGRNGFRDRSFPSYSGGNTGAKVGDVVLRSRRELLVVAGTRPEAIKLAPVVLALRTCGLSPTICLTGQHPELAAMALAGFGIAADHRLSIMRQGQSLDDLRARGEAAVDALLARLRPDCVIVQGDTTSALAAASAAARRGIAVAHVEAGLRSHDLAAPFPEEANRVAIARLAMLHFAPTARARANLIGEGVDPHAVEVTGNTIVDALRLVLAMPAASVPAASDRRLLVATLHRRENRAAFPDIVAALAALADRGDVDVVLPRHPSVDVALYRPLEGRANVCLPPPMAYPPFIGLLARARLVVTDSGGIQEEASVLGVPTLIARGNTERPEAVETGSACIVGTSTRAVAEAAAELLDDDGRHQAMARATSAFGDGDAAVRIARRIADWLSGGRARQSSAGADCS